MLSIILIGSTYAHTYCEGPWPFQWGNCMTSIQTELDKYPPTVNSSAGGPFTKCEVKDTLATAGACPNPQDLEGGNEMHLFVIGDWGRTKLGDSVTHPNVPVNSTQWWLDMNSQTDVAEVMSNVAGSIPEWRKVVITTGDNFYWTGVSQVDDSMFKERWEQIYNKSALSQIPWLATLGNHDYGGGDCMKLWGGTFGDVYASVNQSRYTARWVMDDLFYYRYYKLDTFSVALIMMDSNWANRQMCDQSYCKAYTPTPEMIAKCQADLNVTFNAQLEWMPQILRSLNATHNFVFAHHPFLFYSPEDQQRLRDIFVENNVHTYIAGHTHLLQHTRESAGFDSFISGAGGGGFSETHDYPEFHSRFATLQYGFLHLKISGPSRQDLSFSYITQDGQVVYEYTPYPDSTPSGPQPSWPWILGVIALFFTAAAVIIYYIRVRRRRQAEYLISPDNKREAEEGYGVSLQDKDDTEEK